MGRVLLEKLTGSQLVKKFSSFYSKVPFNCPYLERAQSSPCPHITLPEDPY